MIVRTPSRESNQISEEYCALGEQVREGLAVAGYEIHAGATQGSEAVGPLFDLECREDGERFLDTYRRLGAAPFKEALYGAVTERAA